MSEEEAIKWLKELLQDKEKYVKYHSWVGTNTFVAIQTLLNNYISKDKIRDKIKELEKKREIYEELDSTTVYWEIVSQIQVLEELLEER